MKKECIFFTHSQFFNMRYFDWDSSFKWMWPFEIETFYLEAKAEKIIQLEVFSKRKIASTLLTSYITQVADLILVNNLSISPILPKLWKDVVTHGGAIMAPPLVFRLWGLQNPKTEPWHIFCTKNYLKSHFEHF